MPCERRHIEAILNQLTAIPDTGDGVSWVAYDNSVKAVMDALAACDESPWRTIDIFYSPEDGEYVARLSHAHGISAMGLTPADALRELSVVAGMIPDEFLPAAPEVKP